MKKCSHVLLLSGLFASIYNVTLIDTATKVYNFEVEENHNYFVGKQKILVHNDCNTFLSAIKAKGYAKLENAFLSLDDATRAKFLTDFETKGDDVWKALNDEDLVNIWKKNIDNPNRVSKDWLLSYKQAEYLIANPTRINALSKPPQGYEFFNRNGNKLIKRKNVSEGLPQLTVEDDIIVVYSGQVRENNQALFVKNLENKYGTMPLNHQRHHLVAVNVATDSPIHIEATKRGIYTVDRTENRVYMAQTAEDWDVYGKGISDDLPFHYGSHPQWDAKAKGIISNDYENILIKKYIRNGN